MSDLLSIGSSGVSVNQRALSTVSNNIANLGTEGYSRQTAEIRQTQPTEVGGGFIGTGAYFDRVARQYDSFLESSLQQATSDLEAQGASVEYTNRLLDLLGGDKTSLTDALNRFFSAAKSLSTDPASSALRGIMLRESEGLASQIRSLAQQMDDLGDQAESAMQADIRAVNSLADQIAEINRQTLKKSSERDQAPELLDRRDQLLRDLSEYVQIRTSFNTRGAVTVSLTESDSKGLLVKETDFSRLVVEPSQADQSQLIYRLQGNLGNSELTSIPSGSVAGYAAFYEGTLVQASKQLDQLAQVLEVEVNAIQTNGLDASGNQGADFFTYTPVFAIDELSSASNFEVQVTALNPSDYQGREVSIFYNDQQALWYGEDVSGERIYGNSQGLLEMSDIAIQISGSARVGDQFEIIPDTRAASTITLGLNDGSQIAAASLFRVTPSQKNIGVQDPKVSYTASEVEYVTAFQVDDLDTIRPMTLAPSTRQPATVIRAGVSEIALTLDPSDGADQLIQIVTTDGRHLVGNDEAGDVATMVAALPTFSPSANYSDEYLNVSGDSAYKDIEIFYGAEAKSKSVTQLTPGVGLNYEVPFGVDYAGGTLDITLEPSIASERLDLIEARYADTTVGAISYFNEQVYLGIGEGAQAIGSIESIFNGVSQTLRIRFADTSGEISIGDNVLQGISNLLAFSNGQNLVETAYPVQKRIAFVASDSNFENQTTLLRDFSSEELIDSGAYQTDSNRFLSTLVGRQMGYASGAGRTVIDQGDLELNGSVLSELRIGESGVLSAQDVGDWLATATGDHVVTATNRIEITSAMLKLDSGIGLSFNDVSIRSLATGSTTRFSDADDLVASINARSEQSGVFALTLNNGNIVLQNNDLGGANITVGESSSSSGSNALGVANKTYVGSVALSLESGQSTPIQLELGSSGKPSDLNLLGFDTQVRLSGEIDEDLLVFATGVGSVDLTGEVVNSGISVADGLRSRQFEFEFYQNDHYRIRDLTTDTVVADRSYQGERSLNYQGMTVSLENAAVVGDTFVVDGNNLGPKGAFDGQGNNTNILRFVSLEGEPVFDNGFTLTEGYLGFVADVGNLATQAEIARDALDIVQTQAYEAKDRVSGVSLDKEAADLIRFQQAYQASAQVMQVATKLFDTMLQIR